MRPLPPPILCAVTTAAVAGADSLNTLHPRHPGKLSRDETNTLHPWDMGTVLFPMPCLAVSVLWLQISLVCTVCTVPHTFMLHSFTKPTHLSMHSTPTTRHACNQSHPFNQSLIPSTKVSSLQSKSHPFNQSLIPSTKVSSLQSKSHPFNQSLIPSTKVSSLQSKSHPFNQSLIPSIKVSSLQSLTNHNSFKIVVCVHIYKHARTHTRTHARMHAHMHIHARP